MALLFSADAANPTPFVSFIWNTSTSVVPNEVQAAPPTSAPSGALTASPTRIRVGNVLPGKSMTQTVRLANSGMADVTVSKTTVTGAGFTISGLSLPLTLAAGQSAAFNVKFAPSSMGNTTSRVSIASDAPDSPTTVSLSGSGITMLLSAVPSSLSFGNVLVGGSNIQTDTLHNAGNASITVTAATVTGAAFGISGLKLPLSLAAGQNATFNITFAPTMTGRLAGSISVLSNAANSPATVLLSGSGVHSHFVALSWTASTSKDVSGYNVYRGTKSGGPYTKLNFSLVASTTYSDRSAQAGQTYYYVTTAVDSKNKESAHSNQAKASVPFP